MKYVLWGLFAAVTIVFSFQNCKKITTDVDTQSVVRTDLAQETLLTAAFFVDDPATARRLDFKIDLQTGVITQTSRYDSLVYNYCLTESLRSELYFLLKESQICDIHRTHSEMCITVIIEPYLEVNTSHDTYRLGYSSDGCGTYRVDLCDDKPSVVKTYLANLKSTYQQLSCSY